MPKYIVATWRERRDKEGAVLSLTERAESVQTSMKSHTAIARHLRLDSNSAHNDLARGPTVRAGDPTEVRTYIMIEVERLC